MILLYHIQAGEGWVRGVVVWGISGLQVWASISLVNVFGLVRLLCVVLFTYCMQLSAMHMQAVGNCGRSQCSTVAVIVVQVM